MRISRVHYTSDFQKAYRGLPGRVRELVNRKDALFRENSNYPSLNTHKLGGPLAGLWSFSVNRQYRVLFEFVKGAAIFYDVGTHDIYK